MKHIIAVLIALTLLSGCAFAQELPTVPDFSITDGEGIALPISGFSGQPIILNFWASWCPPCKAEMPEFQTMFEEYGEQVQFIMLNSTDGMRETIAKAQAYIDASGYTFPIYFDTTMDAGNTLRIYALPTTIFIDGQGRIVNTVIGQTTREVLETQIANLLKDI